MPILFRRYHIFTAILRAWVMSAVYGTITGRGVCYSTTNTSPALSQGGTTCQSTTGTTGNYTVNVSSLSSNTRYYFRGYATNSTGTGYTSTTQFTTEGSAPADFPQVVGMESYQSGTGGITSHAVTLPSGITSGNLLLIFFRTGDTGVTHTLSGWTELATRDSNGRTTIFYKVADGTEGSTATITTGAARRSVANSYRITGYSGTPEAAFVASDTNNPPSLSPSWGSAKNLWISMVSTRNNSEIIFQLLQQLTHLLQMTTLTDFHYVICENRNFKRYIEGVAKTGSLLVTGSFNLSAFGNSRNPSLL